MDHVGHIFWGKRTVRGRGCTKNSPTAQQLKLLKCDGRVNFGVVALHVVWQVN